MHKKSLIGWWEKGRQARDLRIDLIIELSGFLSVFWLVHPRFGIKEASNLEMPVIEKKNPSKSLLSPPKGPGKEQPRETSLELSENNCFTCTKHYLTYQESSSGESQFLSLLGCDEVASKCQKEKKEHGAWKILNDTMTENSPNLTRHLNLQIYTYIETEWILNWDRPKKFTPTHHNWILENWRKKFSKTAREKWLFTYMEKSVQATADFSSEIMVARKKWHNIFHVLKEKKCQPLILYSEKIPFRNEENQDIC